MKVTLNLANALKFFLRPVWPAITYGRALHSLIK
jgi:hypothetical protein